MKRIERALAEHEPLAHPRTEHRAAAILLPLFDLEDELHTLFIRRQEHLMSHPGQIAFPGGGVEPEDASIEDSALRETHEEIGVPPDRIQVFGRLDEIETVTGYRIAPVVGRIPYPFTFVLDDYEVAETFVLPIARLRDPAVFREEHMEREGRKYPVYFYELDDRVIWGATAKILRQFLHRVFDDPAPASLSEF